MFRKKFIAYKKLFIFFLSLFIAGSVVSQQTGLKLWYDQPAGKVWEAALPIGNGRLAAMVYGNSEKEIVQLNESSVWSGGPSRNDPADALSALPEVRKLIFEGKYTEAADFNKINNRAKLPLKIVQVL